MFTLYDETNAPDASKTILARTKAAFKMIPNLERTLAGAPAALAGYSTLWDLFDTTSLSAIERQVVYQTANVENNCEYCVPWHTYLSYQAKMPEQDIQALRKGAPLSNPKHEALRQFTLSLIRTKGNILHSDFEQFIDAGYTQEHALEVVLGIATKTISNFTNSIAGTPLDSAVSKFRWQKPTIAMRNA